MAKRFRGVFMALALCALLAGNVYAAPVVTFTVSGSANDWALDFQVTNNLGDDIVVYFFGVQLPNRDIIASPLGWNTDLWLTWNNAGDPYYGPDREFNNNWIAYGPEIGNGETLGGFGVRDTSITAPTSVPWFAYAFCYNEPYTGTDYFYSPVNPGFVGTAEVVPLPSSLMLLGPVLAGLAVIRRRMQK